MVMNIKKLLLFGILSVLACHLSAQKTERTARELGLMMQEFRGAGFIYKGGAHPEKNRHFRISLEDFSAYTFSNMILWNEYKVKGINGVLRFSAGTEKRFILTEKFQLIRGLQTHGVISGTKSKTSFINPSNQYSGLGTPNMNTIIIGLGLRYLVGFRYSLNSKIAFTLEFQPGFTYYPIYELAKNKNNIFEINTGSIGFSATYLFHKNKKVGK